MENELAMNAAEPHGNIMAKSSDNERQYMSHSDILNRRLKNRERQRRYRARKRLEADMKRASNKHSSTVEEKLPQVDRKDSSCITYVPHRRNWKQDARMAHSCNTVDQKLEIAGVAAPSLKNQIEHPAREMETTPIGGMKSNIGNSSFSSPETHKSKLARRNWKAEARNTKA